MNQSIREKLQAACETGEVIRIVYHGGSQPGTLREISPILVSESDVHARDLAVGTTKTFKLSKIELADMTAGTPEYDPIQPAVVELTGTIPEVLTDDVRRLESMGWHILFADNSISVHRCFKNGKPRKTADIELSYTEYTVDAFVDVHGILKEEKRKSIRPYRLASRNFASAKTFKNMSTAVAAFLNEAKLLAPVNTT